MDMTMHHGFCVSVQKSRALAASVAALLHRSAAAAHLNGTPAEREGGGYQGDAAGVAADGTPEVFMSTPTPSTYPLHHDSPAIIDAQLQMVLSGQVGA